MPWLLAAPQADVKPVAPIQAQDQGVVSRVEKHPSDPAAGQIHAQVTRVAPDPGGTASHGRLGPRYPAMSISSSVLLCYGAIPEPDEASIRPPRDPPPGRAADRADAMLLPVQDRDRTAGAVSDLVVRRLFCAGLAPGTAPGLTGGHPGAGKAREATGELDLAIRDVRDIACDHRQPDPPSEGLSAIPGERQGNTGRSRPGQDAGRAGREAGHG